MKPIDMVLHCPKCGMQHVDVPEHWDGKVEVHKSHLCVPAAGGCGHIWRPADVPTNGVQAVKTKGKNDSPEVKETAAQAEPVAFLVEGLHEGKVIAHTLHFTVDDAKKTAAVFAQHYPTVNTKPLYTAPAQPDNDALEQEQQ